MDGRKRERKWWFDADSNFVQCCESPTIYPFEIYNLFCRPFVSAQRNIKKQARNIARAISLANPGQTDVSGLTWLEGTLQFNRRLQVGGGGLNEEARLDESP
jgi:hypothetical protein